MASVHILITGAAGFVGSAILRAVLVECPSAIIGAVDLNVTNLHEDFMKNERIRIYQADITVPESIRNVIAAFGPAVVVHTAGLVPTLAERHLRRLQTLVYQVNVEGTRNVVNAAVSLGTPALVYTSSCCAIVDDMSTPYVNIDETWPTSKKSLIYGESKALAEEIVLEANSTSFSTCILRPSVLLGPGDQSLLPPIHACIAKFETPFVIGPGTNLWDVTYVDNIADAHVLAVKNLLTTKTAAGEVFFIQNNEPITFRDLSLAIWANFGHTPPFEIHIPLFLAWLVGLIAEIFTWITGTTTTLSRGSVNDACSMRYASGRKAREILGYEARIKLPEAVELSCKDYAARLERSRGSSVTTSSIVA